MWKSFFLTVERGDTLNMIVRGSCKVFNPLLANHDCVQELLHRVRVPPVDGESLGHLIVIIKQFNDWVRPTNILDGQTWVPRWSLALDERAYLRVCPQPSSAHLQYRLLILGVLQVGAAPVIVTAAPALSRHLPQVELS